MAIYTSISKEQAQILFNKIGKIISLEGIQEGVENTNYKVILDNQSKYILTIFEKRTKVYDIPYFNNAMQEFKQKGIPCPTAVSVDKQEVFKINNKSCSIYNFLNGRPLRIINNQALESLSEIVADLHNAGKNTQLKRKNTMLLTSWQHILNKFENMKDNKFINEINFVKKTIIKIQDQFPENLEKSLIHGDLFPDNIFFKDDKVSGVIDFFFTCNDTIIYDLSTLINSWFFSDKFSEGNCKLFLDNYLNIRNLKSDEKKLFNFYLQVSSIRFFLTRLHDIYFNSSQNVIHKNPMDFFSILKFHQKNNLQDLI